jgi:precorrin-6B methylase 2
MSQGATAEVLPRQGTREQFARLRRNLEEIGYTTAVVNKRRGMLAFDEPPPSEIPTSALDVLILLFLDGAAVARPVVFEHMPSELLELLHVFGLLVCDENDGGACHAPLALYPTGGVYIVSDHRGIGLGEARKDLVFPAFSANSAEFLASLPTTACESLLDLGAGTAVAALIGAASYARHAWAVDVTARATRMAEFNAQLNDSSNITVLRGDLYEPVSGISFDRIVSHPPYMPANDEGLIFRDGGEDGEAITRRVIEGLPAHLRPGGRFCCRCMASDRKGAPLEKRLRAMLGEAHAEFDVVLTPQVTIPLELYLCNTLSAGGLTADEYNRLRRVYLRLEVENMVIGFVFMERHGVKRTPITLRRQLPAGTHPARNPVDWLLERERAQFDPAVIHALFASRPAITPHTSIELTHRAREGTLQPASCAVTSSFPYGFRMEAPPGIAMLVGHCDGSLTVAELETRMREVGVIGSDTSSEEFARIVLILIGGGVLESVEFPLPPRA